MKDGVASLIKSKLKTIIFSVILLFILFVFVFQLYLPNYPDHCINPLDSDDNNEILSIVNETINIARNEYDIRLTGGNPSNWDASNGCYDSVNFVFNITNPIPNNFELWKLNWVVNNKLGYRIDTQYIVNDGYVSLD